MKLTLKQVGEIKAKAKEVTATLRTQTDVIARQEAALKAAAGSREARAVKLIRELDICSDGQETVRKLIMLLTGLELPELPDREDRDDSDTFEAFSMLVPTKDDNDHCYPLNVPVLMLGEHSCDDEDCAVDMRGFEGDHLAWDASGLIPATDKQIDEFFDMWEKLVGMGMSISCDGLVEEEEEEDSAF